MEYAVYILWSTGHRKSYVGFTSDLINRISSHNFFGNDWTKSFRPWEVIHLEFFNTKQEAMKREKYFKSGRGLYIKNGIIENYLSIS